jgi:hypothetical protein
MVDLELSMAGACSNAVKLSVKRRTVGVLDIGCARASRQD